MVSISAAFTPLSACFPNSINVRHLSRLLVSVSIIFSFNQWLKLCIYILYILIFCCNVYCEIVLIVVVMFIVYVVEMLSKQEKEAYWIKICP